MQITKQKKCEMIEVRETKLLKFGAVECTFYRHERKKMPEQQIVPIIPNLLRSTQ